MARRRGKRNKRANPRRRGGIRRRRPRVRGAPQQSTGLGRAIATGVKSLVSGVPTLGPILGKTADFFFKAIGLVSSDVQPGQRTINDVAVNALQANIGISVASLIMGSKLCIQIPSPQQRAVKVNYHEARVIELTIEVIPNNPIQKRAGELTLTFQPFFTEDDLKAGGASPYDKSPIYQESLRRQFLNTSGPADRILSVTYRPRPADGLAYQYRCLWDTENNRDLIGQCCIFYRNVARDTQADFTPSEFHCQVVVSGKFETRASPSSARELTLNRAVQDTLATIGMYIITPNRLLYCKNDASYQCKVSNDGTKCVVSGVFGAAGEQFEDCPSPYDDYCMVNTA